MSDATSAALEPTSAPADEAFDPAETIRQARAFLALQREIAGPTRFLGPTPVASGDTDIATSGETNTSASGDTGIAVSGESPAPTPETEPLAAREVQTAPASGDATHASAPEADLPIDSDASPEAPDDSDSTVPNLFGESPEPSQDPTLSPYERIASLIPEDSPLRDMSSLQEINEWLSNTVLVPIDETRINPVLGTGPADADLMVIGEAPGADEDKRGEPFVGRAGQLLDKILDAVLFDRDEVYIANILKSRPPNNRDPLPAEVEAHIPILYKQIALVQPKMILAVGKSAGNGLLGKTSSLGSLRGRFHDYYGLPLMVTYHPAALLRNQQWKRPTWEDVKLLRTRYDELGGASRRRDA